MRTKNIFAVLIIFIVFANCETPVKEAINISLENGKDSVSLILKDTISIPLDSVTTASLAYFQYCEASNSLFMLNRKQRAIYQFSLDEVKEIRKIKYFEEGPNGVGKIEAFYYHNPDTIITYDRRYNRVSIINQSGRLLQSKVIINELEQLGVKYTPFPSVSTNMPMIYDHKLGKIFFSGYHPGEYDDDNEINRRVLLDYDLRTHVVRANVAYPPVYSGNVNWGGQHFRAAYYTYNMENNLLIFSFPASHELVTWCEEKPSKGTTKLYYAGSYRIERIAARPAGAKQLSAEDNFFKYFLETPSYGSIIYDSYRQLYYRFVHLPIPEGKRQNEYSDKQVGIVILNKAFEKVGEIWLEPYTFSSSQYFITKEGLFLRSYQRTEDFLTLGKFTLSNKSN